MSDKSDFIPNSFYTPNAYVDKYMHLLTCEEWKVLSYAVRRIFGFHKRQDRISLSQFTHGIKNTDDKQLDNGTGLSVETNRKCLNSLCSFGLMIKIEKNDPKTNEGILWGLQLESKNVHLSKLSAREKEQSSTQKEKMLKARSMRQTHPNDIEGGSSNDTTPPPSNGIETQHTEGIKGNSDNGADAPKQPKANQIPEVVLFREVTKRYPNSANFEDVVSYVKKVSARLGHDATRDDLLTFFKAWTAKGYNPSAITWLEWAETGQIPVNGTWKSQRQSESEGDRIDRILGVTR